ncbi:glycosyltransferase family 1 protein [Conexibacter sp. CPCC 206217]|uniref:glycosyltransferase family 4 protein n=1 Tax=Conexibacter sp. CPCC 206217 TaxID=3064574 RepID=UPI002722040D|nr:glycosyltransferase family 1 protein [Conexibacter sp. CPCC 206217]MDO8210014.1 glycosyltransferase family 1 protein [Conexibacter sp. CPCC 206217]
MPSELRRVGLNLLYLVPGQVGGSEVYARELVGALGRARPELELLAFANDEGAPSLAQAGWPANVRIVRLPVRGANKPARIATELARLPLAARHHRVELLHSLGTTGPIVAGVPHVLSILDLIYAHYPETFPAAARLGLGAVVGPAARRADRVVTISEAVKRDVVQRLNVPAERVDAVLLGYGAERARATPAPPAALRERFGLGEGRVVLCVSAALVHKNLPRLIDAFAQLGPGFEDCRLVLVGHHGRDSEALREHAERAGVSDRIVQTGWIEADVLEGLYALASCCAYPSLHEGFGLPPLEAMVREVPLACSDATSLPEVVGDAAELFEPTDPRAIRDAIARLLTDPARAAELVASGRRRVGLFTWDRCAEGVLASYERALRPATRA